MARKSRKNIVVSTKPITKKYRAAAYALISVQKAGQPSDSIEGQLHLIEDFILQQDVMELAGCYIDENESGTSFQRKGFQKMLDDIAAGKINCVIVKDLSRFGRNFIETGFYLEQLFPLKRVRFISINDGWDSVDGVTNQNPLGKSSGVIPLTNYINEAFVEDIRRKTQSSIDLCIDQGGFIAPRAPYGYQKSADNCHQLIVDPVAADVVRHIFIMAAQQEGLTEIVRKLNAEKVLPPSAMPLPMDYRGIIIKAMDCGTQGVLRKF
ncbi:recombinase family protein [Megasphaera cerevisiae]|uniref:recombinase family protein n=1 Tax=Megasphaera cerevisiae TaxID=39029 RepID=UPI0009FB79C6|nr:recombinase family protein [Megasphaera cerevisiae]